MGVNVLIKRFKIGEQLAQVRQDKGCAVKMRKLGHDDLLESLPTLISDCEALAAMCMLFDLVDHRDREIFHRNVTLTLSIAEQLFAANPAGLVLAAFV